MLYGSAARGDYAEGTSDINLLLVLEDVDAGDAARARAGVHRLAVRLSRAAAGDQPRRVGPRHRRLSGRAHRHARLVPGAARPRSAGGRHRPPADLRRELESELRGKLLRLRQGYTLLADDPDGLGALALRSAPTALVLCRAMLALLGTPVTPPGDMERVVRAAAAAAGFPPDAMLEVVRHRGQREWRCDTGTFEGYLDAVARMAMYVDQLQPGDD